ncbi:aminoacyl-tRNA hydrolase [Hwanghaeella grinnelliae]|uniref:Peptidyl-tRNA hydrolase n=1 Tax=Hwanghaeella grinnelliae TaxID=2500179 RepID=A0A3S2ZA77_9PROT|nr:aminoacyl-tRNA hydrolase [Hwanghaeella grinnelliae]RVU37948.1 aminoacyl-tRNA hydrolase [Hwanghaeella grinnelliae]
MLLIVGLGNPGPKYERNRHNVGFMAVDEIVRRHSFGPWRARFQAQVSEGQIGGRKVMVMKPMTFMNESGKAVGEAARFFKIAAEDIWVFYDELDLASAKLKVKQGGGHAGHNGLRSIDAHLAKDLGKEYWRVRIGIGHPGDKAKVHGHVLGDFSKAEWPTTEKLIDAMADAFPTLVERGYSDFMSKVALILKPARHTGPDGPASSPSAKTASAGGETNIPAATAGDKDKNRIDSALAQAMAKVGLGRKNKD